MKTWYLIATLFICAIISQSGFGKSNVIFLNNELTLVQPPQGNRPQRTPEERAKRETEWMKTDLTLTEAQIPLVDTINLKYAKKQMELRNQMQGQDWEAMRTKRQELQTQKGAYRRTNEKIPGSSGAKKSKQRTR